jgi:hypothetical protein
MSDLLYVWLPVIATLIAGIFGVFFMFIGMQHYAKSVLLGRRGQAGQAKVTRHYQKRRFKSGRNHHGQEGLHTNRIDYDIRLYGKSYKAKGLMPSKDLWHQLSVGSKVDVIYLPMNPKNSRLAETPARVGRIGGVVQIIAGAVMTTGAAVYIIAGLLDAVILPKPDQAHVDWLRDQAVVLSINKSDDPFVRVTRPNTRLVHFEVGDDDGGRDYLGQVNISLGPDEFPELRIGDVLTVMRAPNDKSQAVLLVLE